MEKIQPYKSKNKIRILTAGSLFDGHDAAINIMRRIMQRSGAEVIHLGHNRSVKEIVDAAIQEDVQGIAITSYQGGHNEFFKYAHDLLKEQGSGHIKPLVVEVELSYHRKSMIYTVMVSLGYTLQMTDDLWAFKV